MSEKFRARKTKTYKYYNPMDVWIVEHERPEWMQVAECEDEGKAKEMARLLNERASAHENTPRFTSAESKKWWAIWMKSGS